MRILVIAVGRPRGIVAATIAEYEQRARRYWKLEVIEVEAGAGANASPEEVRQAEARRIGARIPEGMEVIALTRGGKPVSSRGLELHLSALSVISSPGAVFIVGGAFGLSAALLDSAARRLSLSAMTLPHELARLVLAEQLYRAGTIRRNEPYHKGDG